MDVLLVVPPGNSHYIVPPIGLGYLAATIKEFSDVKILDCLKEKSNFEDFRNYIIENKPKVVGIQVFSCACNDVLKCINIIKNIDNSIIVIVGGVHITITGSSSLNSIFYQADYGFIGEAEIGFPMLIKKLRGDKGIHINKIPGLIWRTSTSIEFNDRVFNDNLDSLKSIAWELIPPNNYPDNPQGVFYNKFPIAPISSSRGCPFECTYCASFTNMGRKVRFRSIQNVLNEMEYLINNYGIKEFHFIDDVFTLKRVRVIEFCKGIKERKFNISYTFPNGIRLDSLDKEILLLMKETGLYSFTVGIESGTQKILNKMQKKLTLELIEEKINLINSVGIEPSGFFIVGYPSETEEDINETIMFAKKLKIKRAHFSNFLPLPGTKSTADLLASGEIKEIDFNTLVYSDVPYSPVSISKERLKQLQRKAYLSFYLRPHILYKMLKEIKSYNHFKSIVNRAIDYLFKNAK